MLNKFYEPNHIAINRASCLIWVFKQSIKKKISNKLSSVCEGQGGTQTRLK